MNSQKKKDTGDAIVRKPLAIVEVQEVLHQWYDLQYNEVKHVVEGRKKGEGCFNEMKDNNLLIQLLSNGYRISQSTLKALLNSDFVPSFNPILKYFESLPPWDEGNRDYITELANHVKAIGIDNVWSQAYALYKSGFRFQLTADELKENESRNEQYQAVTMEYEYVQQYFTPSTSEWL